MRACPIASSAAVPTSTPMRGTRSRCCARAASGHTVAAPPSSVTISRRFIVVTCKVGARTALHQNRKDRRTEGRCDNVRCGNLERFMSLQGLGRAETFGSAEFWAFEGCRFWDWLCPDRCRQRPDTYDAHHPRHIVGQHVQFHL